MNNKKRTTGKRKQTLRNAQGDAIEPHINQRSRRQCVKRRLFQCVVRSFKDQAGQIESQRKGVTDEHGFGGVGQAKGGGTFEVSAGLGGIAALGIRLPADAQLPGIRTDLQVTCEADGTIREREGGRQGKSQTGGQDGRRDKWHERSRMLRRGYRDQVGGST